MEITEKVVVPDSLGLHLRSAAKLVLLVSRYQCEVRVYQGPKSANAKSIIGLISLGALEGMELSFGFEGKTPRPPAWRSGSFFSAVPTNRRNRRNGIKIKMIGGAG